MSKTAIHPKDLFYKFDFGIFDGFALKDVYSGMGAIPRPIVLYYVGEIISKFLQSMPNQSNDYDISFDDRSISMHNNTSNNKYFTEVNNENFSLLDNYITNMFNNYGNIIDFKENSFIHKINELELTLNDNKKKTLCFPDEYNLHLERGSPNYIEWCINNLDHFFLTPLDIETLQAIEVSYFIGIKITCISKTYFTIEQYFNYQKYIFLETTLQNNSHKWNRYVRAKRRTTNIEPGTYENPRRYSDQDYINDAFGGEADAYWNID